MPRSSTLERQEQFELSSERVAYWYFRLNGFLLLENFVVHNVTHGGQRTDADLIGIRFRHRQELLYDAARMVDDVVRLQLSTDFDDIVIVEVKKSRRCTLNVTWTEPERRNVQRVIAATGCIPCQAINDVASSLYETGLARHGATRIRLIAVGGHRNAVLSRQKPGVVQLTWDDVLSFIWTRLTEHRQHKRHVSQWDDEGKKLHELAARTQESFISTAKSAMGIPHVYVTTR